METALKLKEMKNGKNNDFVEKTKNEFVYKPKQSSTSGPMAKKVLTVVKKTVKKKKKVKKEKPLI